MQVAGLQIASYYWMHLWTSQCWSHSSLVWTLFCSSVSVLAIWKTKPHNYIQHTTHVLHTSEIVKWFSIINILASSRDNKRPLFYVSVSILNWFQLLDHTAHWTRWRSVCDHIMGGDVQPEVKIWNPKDLNELQRGWSKRSKSYEITSQKAKILQNRVTILILLKWGSKRHLTTCLIMDLVNKFTREQNAIKEDL